MGNFWGHGLGIQISFAFFLLFIVRNMAFLLLLAMEATCHWWGSLRGLHGFIVNDFMLYFDLFRFWLFGFPFISPPPNNHLHWPSFLYLWWEDGTEFGEDFRNVGIGTWVVVDQATTKNSHVPIYKVPKYDFKTKWWDFCLDLSPSLVCAGLAFLQFPSCNQIYVYKYKYMISLSLYIYIMDVGTRLPILTLPFLPSIHDDVCPSLLSFTLHVYKINCQMSEAIPAFAS